MYFVTPPAKNFKFQIDSFGDSDGDGGDGDGDGDGDDDDDDDGDAKIRNLDQADAIDFVQKSPKSKLSSRFLSRLKFENSHDTFWRIQPIVPGFV